MQSTASRRVEQDLAPAQQQQSFASTKCKDDVRAGIRSRFLGRAQPLVPCGCATPAPGHDAVLRGSSHLP